MHRSYEQASRKSTKRTQNVKQQEVLPKLRNCPALILPLLVGMVIVAVQAKTLHYSAKDAEARYFSASVKIANLAPHDSQPQSVAILVTLPKLARAEARGTARPEISPKSVNLPIKTSQPRSPPLVVL